MNAKIHEESNGLLRLDKFVKTNGQKSSINGVDLYTMECTVEVVANKSCAMTGFRLGGAWDGTFTALKAQQGGNVVDAFNPSGAAYGMNRQLAEGARLAFNVKMVFDLTERGWRTENRLPPDVPFKPDLPSPAAVVGVHPTQDTKQFPQLILGKWQSGNGLTWSFSKDGSWVVGPAGFKSQWKIEGDKLRTGPSGHNEEFFIITSLTEKELVIEYKGEVKRLPRISH